MSASTASYYWFLPLQLDPEFIGTWPPEGAEPTLDYMASVVEAAEDAGFEALLAPTSYLNHHETWTAVAATLARTRRARALIAVRPNQYHPAQLAKMAATLQNLFPGRIELNVVTGGWDEDRWIGSFDDRSTRYRRVREWFDVVTGIWDESPFSYEGTVYRLEEAQLAPEPSAPIPIFFSGSSPEARQIALDFADVFLLWGSPLADIAREITQMRSLGEKGAQLRFGLRVHVIVRESTAEAWEAAERLISRVDPRIAETLAGQSHSDSVARAAQQQLTRGDLVIAPNLWAGVGTARFGVATALVGNAAEVAARLEEYRSVGIDVFILSGYPKLAEARRFGELVMPRLRPT